MDANITDQSNGSANDNYGASMPPPNEPTEPSPALQKKVEAVRGLVAREEKCVALTRYAIGAHVAEVMGDEERYGTGAVGTIARAVERDEDSLYDYASVTEAWSEKEVRALLARRNSRGATLTFSHLVELAKKNKKKVFRLTPERRAELLQQTFAESLSVRELAVRIRNSKAKATGKTDTEIEAGRLIPMSNRAVGMVRRLEEQLPALRDEAKMSSAQLGLLVDNCAAIECAAAKLRLRAATMLARLHPSPAPAPRDAA